MLFQSFFCRIAGIDPDILKKDSFKKERSLHTTTGSLILLTSIIASLSGGFAGYSISNGNLTISILLGVIWGLLIFNIDRGMILTMKKNEHTTSKEGKFLKPQWILIYFAPRALLAILISFFISIPLELQIFKEEISQEKALRNQNELETYEYNESIKLDKWKNEAETLEDEKKNLEDQKSKKCSSSNCLDIDNRLRIKKRERLKSRGRLVSLKREIGKHFEAAKIYEEDSLGNKVYRLDSLSKAYKDFSVANSEYNKERNNLGKLNRSIESLNRDSIDAQLAYLRKFEKDINVLEDRLAKTDSILVETQDSVTQATNSFKQNLIEDSFIRQYKFMESAANHDRYLFFMLWFIRAIFFGIEILPTIFKISSPANAYDMELVKGLKIKLEKDKKDEEAFKEGYVSEVFSEYEQEREIIELKSGMRIQQERDIYWAVLNMEKDIRMKGYQKEIEKYWEEQIRNPKYDIPFKVNPNSGFIYTNNGLKKYLDEIKDNNLNAFLNSEVSIKLSRVFIKRLLRKILNAYEGKYKLLKKIKVEDVGFQQKSFVIVLKYRLFRALKKDRIIRIRLRSSTAILNYPQDPKITFKVESKFSGIIKLFSRKNSETPQYFEWENKTVIFDLLKFFNLNKDKNQIYNVKSVNLIKLESSYESQVLLTKIII